MPPEKPLNEVPFRRIDPLDKEGMYFVGHSIEEDPDLFIKQMRSREDMEADTYHPLNDLERIKTDFNFLKQNFGEVIPGTEFVVGKNEKGNEVVFVAQSRIEGDELPHLNYDPKVAEELEKFLRKCIKVFVKNLKYNPNSGELESFIPDLQASNLMFGVDLKRENSRPHLYLTDTYPVLCFSLDKFSNWYLDRLLERFPKQWLPVVINFINEIKQELDSFNLTKKVKVA